MPAASQAVYHVLLSDANKLGPLWSTCVAAFVAFEKAAGFPLQDNCLPPSSNRPHELGKWFKHG